MPKSFHARAAAVIASFLIAGLIAWLLIDGDGDSSPGAANATTTAETVRVVPLSQLPAATDGLRFPIYWAGPRAGTEYEVTRRSGFENRIWVRYLPHGSAKGTHKRFLTVISIPLFGAFQSLRYQGQRPDTVFIKLPGGGEAYAEDPRGTNAYLAFHGVGTEIEVYDPRPGEALRLIRSGAIVPIGSS